MEIRHAVLEDLDELMKIFEYARNFMASHDNPDQWGLDNWPPKWLIEKDIEVGKSYVCLNEGNIVGTFFLDYGKNVEHTYDQIDGKWLGGPVYGVVHRIAGDGSVKGIGKACIDWAYERCGHLRMDTHEDNYVMQNLLKKLGFEYCGIIYLEDRDENDKRLAFEKV